MEKSLLKLFVLLIFLAHSVQAQVGIGTTTPKATLDIVSPTSGMLVPRYATLALANANSLPTLTPTDHKGLMIYVDEVANRGFWFYDGSTFVKVGTPTGALPIANGGTGATTAGAALNALLPAQNGNAGKTLTSDGTNANWQKTASRTRSIILDLGSIDVSIAQNGTPPTKITYGSYGLPVIAFADGITSIIKTQIPIPADWNGTSDITATLFYSSLATSGNFYMVLAVLDISLSTNIATAPPYFCSTTDYAPSTTQNQLMSKTIRLNCGISAFPASTKILHLIVQRYGSDAGDTATGSFNLLGIRIDYQD